MTTISALKQYVINFTDSVSTARSVMFWIAIALALAYFIVYLASKNKTTVNKIFGIVGAFYVAATLITFAYFTSKENIEDGGISPYTLYPMLLFAVLVVATGFVLALSKNEGLRKSFVGFTILALEVVVICLIVYFITGEPTERNYIEAEDVNSLALWLGSLALVILIVGLSFTDKRPLKFDARSITYAGIMIALSFALSYIRVLKMPMGGSITLASLLPIMLYSYMFGVKKGMIVGLIYGVLQAIQDPWILHPAQFLLDYPIAFAGIGLAGILRSTKLKPVLAFVLGALIASVLRFASHFISGVFAFGSYSESYESLSPLLYSLVYNSTFVFPDAGISIVIGTILMFSKSFSRAILNVDKPKAKAE